MILCLFKCSITPKGILVQFKELHKYNLNNWRIYMKKLLSLSLTLLILLFLAACGNTNEEANRYSEK